ncbi:uncharacterized protein LOC142777083 [Rhipicephalus microplus]|uniref:uncharacterized protein LOC142777083 n=1 Tax=Rhipicephalus microplus TaxID=6941 RepID=UPI003F6AAFA3
MVAWLCFAPASCTEPHGTDGGLVRLHPRPLRPTDLPLPPFTEIHTDDAQCTAKPPPDLLRFAPSRMSCANHVTDSTPPIHRQDKSPNITHGPTSGLGNTSRMADAYLRRLFFVQATFNPTLVTKAFGGRKQ